MSLGTSLVLLAALVEGTEDLSLQIWDLAYGVLLSAQSMPVPSGIPFPHLSLNVADEGQVLLTVSVSSSRDSVVAPKRSSIHIVPVDPRLKSTIAGALGKTALTAEWLTRKRPHDQEHPEDSESDQIVSKIQEHLRHNHVQKAERAFLTWVDSHSVRASYPPCELTTNNETVKRGRSWV